MTTHTFFGVYPNDSCGQKFTKVDDKATREWMHYSRTFRFGRAQIVDGKCMYKGCVTDEVILKYGTIGEYTKTLSDAKPEQESDVALPDDSGSVS